MAEVDDPATRRDRRRIHVTRPAVLLLDDPQVAQRHGSHESEAKVPHEEAAHLGLVDIRTRHVEAERLGGQPSAVGEVDTGIEMRPVLGGLRLHWFRRHCGHGSS
jgi:hypothetical protein